MLVYPAHLILLYFAITEPLSLGIKLLAGKDTNKYIIGIIIVKLIFSDCFNSMTQLQ